MALKVGVGRLNVATIAATIGLSVVLSLAPDVNQLRWLLVVLVVVGLVTSLPYVDGVGRVVAVSSLVVGVVAGMAVGATAEDWALGIAQMATVFAFFVLVRLVEVPLMTGGFHHALARLVTGRLGIRGRGTAGAVLAYGLTSGLSIGAVPIAYRFTEALWNDTAGGDAVAPRGKVVAEAFTAANSWTPVSPIVAVALQTTNVPLLPVLVWTVPLSLAAILATVYLKRSYGRVDTGELQASRRGGSEFIAVVFVLITMIVLIERLLRVSLVAASMVSIIIVVILWQVTLQQPAVALRSVADGLVKTRQGWPQQFTLLCAGGPLIAAAISLGRQWMTGAAQHGPTFLMVVATPFAILLLSALSLYPMISMIAIGTALTAGLDASTKIALAVALIAGASGSFLVSPLTGLSLLIGDMARRSPFEVALRWNSRYGLGFLALGTLVTALAYVVVR